MDTCETCGLRAVASRHPCRFERACSCWRGKSCRIVDTAADAIATLRDADLSTRLAVAGFGPPRSGVPTRGRKSHPAYVDMAYAHRLAGDDGW